MQYRVLGIVHPSPTPLEPRHYSPGPRGQLTLSPLLQIVSHAHATYWPGDCPTLGPLELPAILACTSLDPDGCYCHCPYHTFCPVVQEPSHLNHHYSSWHLSKPLVGSKIDPSERTNASAHHTVYTGPAQACSAHCYNNGPNGWLTWHFSPQQNFTTISTNNFTVFHNG